MSNVIDPHSVFDNLRNVELENLNFFCELTVTKRTRLTTSIVNDDTVKVNFMGYSDNGKFTTNWTENEENFGIRSINITTNASYVPQVDIEFEDVRGQALFSKKGKSQYEALMMMPPPIFDLKIKGYYGQMISYRLHLIRQNTKFDNGSYIITANFVGMTFAPLSDLLVDYIQVAPYLRGSETTGSFLNFIYETKMLVNDIKVATSPDEDKIKILNDEIKQLNSILTLGEPFQNIKKGIEDIQGGGYSELTKCVLEEGLSPTSPSTIKIYFSKFASTENVYNEFTDKLNLLVDDYINNMGSEYITATKTPQFSALDGFYNPDRDGDFNLVMKINFKIGREGTIKAINSKVKSKKDEIEKLNDFIKNYKNDMVTKSGVDPSLRGVLNLILSNAKAFYDSLKEIVINIESLNRGGQAGEGGEDSKYAFPDFFENRNINGQTMLVKSMPNGGVYDSWNEVQFVNEYIEAKRKSALYIEEKIRTLDIDSTRIGRYVPVSTYDSGGLFFKQLNVNKFIDDMYLRSIILSMNSYYGIYDNDEFMENEAEYLSTLIRDNENLRIGVESYLSKFNKSVLESNKLFDTYRKGDLKFEENQPLFTLTEYDNYSPKPKLKDNLNLNTSFNFDGTYVGYGENNMPIYIDNKYIIEDGSITNTYNGGISQYLKSDVTKNLVDWQKNNIVTHLNNSNMNLNRFIEIFIDKVTSHHDVLYGDNKFAGVYAVPTIIVCKWVSGKEFKDYSENTRNKFNEYYNIINEKYFNQNYLGYWEEYVNLCKEYNNTKTNESINRIIECNLFKELFRPTLINLNNRNMFDSGSLITFGELDRNIYKIKYEATTARYINTLFNKIRDHIKNRNKNEVRQGGSYESSIQHMDLKSQLYYTFKSFVDRWIINPPDGIEKMFDSSTYLTVDRGFNDIGNDVMLDLSTLYNLEYNADTSLYTLLLDLLSKNNFEFFALPSFIEYGTNGFWGNNNINDIFGTHQVGEMTATPKYIAMYIGGTSSFLDIENDSGYKDDSGFTDTVVGLENTQIFRVDIGGGNQSFFTSVELDQLEFKETNESIRLLDNLTKSSENPTTRAGNSLMNIYEQRSYTATVTMMGCMMIQPTMYFELTMPLFKGTYLIIEVSHQVVENVITTKFKGVRIPRVPKPYVNESAIGYNTELNNSGGSTNNMYSIGGSNDGTIGFGAVKLPVNNKTKAFMDMIAYAEGTINAGKNDGYDYIIGGKFIPNWSNTTTQSHPFMNMTEFSSSASGRYQALKQTWIDYYKDAAQVTPFTALNQDKVCNNFLITGWKRYNLDINKITKDNFINFVDAVANYYASLPFYNTINSKIMPKYDWSAGMSFHFMVKDGVKVSQLPRGNRNNINKLWEVFSQALDTYNGVTANLSRLNNEQKKNVASLHPAFQPIVANFIYNVQQSTDYDIVFTSSYRSPSKQESLQNTNSLAAKTSLHEFGLAFDCNLYNRKTKETIIMGNSYAQRLTNKSKWEKTGVIAIANKMNMIWGGTFSNLDLVHFEMTTKNGNKISTITLLEMMKQQGLSMNNVQQLDLSRLS